MHDFCVNSFHYHNANPDDYYSHYRTSAVTAYEVASVARAAFVDHNLSVDFHQTDDGYNVEMFPSHLSYSDDDNADAIVDGADLREKNNKIHLVSVATLVPLI